MLNKIKKLYLIKREVEATSLKQALVKSEVVYEIQLADEKLWPSSKKKLGFDKK